MRHAHLDSDKLMSHLQSQESLSDQYAGLSRTLSFSPSFSLGYGGARYAGTVSTVITYLTNQ